MAEYREIEGVAVESKSGSTGTIEGQIFYDSATDTFKVVDNTGVKTIDTE